MTDSEFENYLDLLGRMLRLSAKQRAEISFELRDHLEERLEELLSQGHSRHEAIRIAVEELGDAGGLAEHFVSINQLNKRRWAMRFATFSIVGCFIGALLVFSLWPDQDRLPLSPRSAAQESLVSSDAVQADTVEARNAKTREILDNTIVDLELDQMQVQSLIETWGEKYKITFYLDESSDLKAETPLNINLRQVRLSMALELLMRQHNSEYIVRDGLILIASVDEMTELGSEIRVYNCRDLVGQYALKEANLSAPSGGALGENVGGPATRSPKEAELVQLVRSVVAPETWEESGQSVVVYDGLMVVKNSAKVHEQIEKLLTQLRKVGFRQVSLGGGADPK